MWLYISHKTFLSHSVTLYLTMKLYLTIWLIILQCVFTYHKCDISQNETFLSCSVTLYLAIRLFFILQYHLQYHNLPIVTTRNVSLYLKCDGTLYLTTWLYILQCDFKLSNATLFLILNFSQFIFLLSILLFHPGHLHFFRQIYQTPNGLKDWHGIHVCCLLLQDANNHNFESDSCLLYTRRDNLGDSAPHLNAAVATKILTLYVAKDRDINRGTYRVYHSFKGLESTNYREHMLYGVCNCGQLNK